MSKFFHMRTEEGWSEKVAEKAKKLGYRSAADYVREVVEQSLSLDAGGKKAAPVEASLLCPNCRKKMKITLS